MTLATVPQYGSSRATERGEQAVVVGAGIAGLLAARVLTDHFETVTVVDSDSLVDEPVARRGVPQGHHPHALLEAGRATLVDLFPGYDDDLVAAGGVVVDFASDVRFYSEGGFLAHSHDRLETVSASRPLIEQILRRHVSGLEAVRVRPDCQLVDYLLDDTATTVEEVRLRDRSGQEEFVTDLVVDATGRASRTPGWLERHGYTPPAVDDVRIDLAYSTVTIERPTDDRRTVLVPPSAPRTRGGMAAPVEGDRWVVNMQGMHGDAPPTDVAGFTAFAASLPTPAVERLLEAQPWVSDEIEHYPFPSNRRHRYETLERFPEGLVVVGDAIASFNPVYAQGMSVAALEALVLHDALAAGGCENLALRFFDRIESVVDVAWRLAAGSDFAFAQTTGPKPRGTDLVDWYLARLIRRAHTDSTLAGTFMRVLAMEQPPSTLFRPGVVWRVFGPTRTVES